MPTDLARHIQTTPLVDTHEHQRPQQEFIDQGPDVLRTLFHHYLHTDLRTAGASQAAIERAANSADPDVEARFEGVREAWSRCRHTGYGQAVSCTPKLVYGLDALTLPGILAAETIQRKLRLPVQRLRLLRNLASLDRVQIDDNAHAVLLKKLAGGQPTAEEANCLGDWSLARGVELAIQHNLPVKIHTGYLAGWDKMLTEHLRPGLLCPLLFAYPQARFVLMHAAYPYSAELAAIAIASAWMRDNHYACFDVTGRRAANRQSPIPRSSSPLHPSG